MDLREAVANVLADAKRKGIDEADMLERRGFLLTPARACALEIQALERAASTLEEMTVAQIVGRTSGTSPQDVKNGIIRLLREWAK